MNNLREGDGEIFSFSGRTDGDGHLYNSKDDDKMSITELILDDRKETLTMNYLTLEANQASRTPQARTTEKKRPSKQFDIGDYNKKDLYIMPTEYNNNTEFCSKKEKPVKKDQTNLGIVQINKK